MGNPLNTPPEMEKIFPGMAQKMNDTFKMIDEFSSKITPKSSKKILIDGEKATASLNQFGSITIDFDNKDNAEEFYNELSCQ